MMNGHPRFHEYIALLALMTGVGVGEYGLMQKALNSEGQLAARRIESCLGRGIGSCLPSSGRFGHSIGDQRPFEWTWHPLWFTRETKTGK